MSGIKPPEQTKEQFRRYKRFYCGGRVECFAVGVKQCHIEVVDMNSAYPEAMKHRHPFSPNGIWDDRLPADTEIERALIRVKCISDGAFPHRDRNGALIFPHDDEQREYFITGWEWLAALDLNAVRHIEIVGAHTFPLSVEFNEYVDRFYTERLAAKAAGDKATDIFCKLFMNSVYGKFGSNPGGVRATDDEEDSPTEGYQEYMLASNDKLSEHKLEGFEPYKKWGERDLLIRPLPEIKHRYYNVATAASITGYVRARLFRASRQCRGLVYCDTDSLCAEDVSALSLGSALGQWKLELTGRQYGVAGKKNYAFESADATLRDYHAFESREAKTGHWKIASKGAKLTPQEIMRVAAGEVITYRPESPTYTITRAEPRFINRNIRRTSLAHAE